MQLHRNAKVTHLMIQAIGPEDIIVDYLDIQAPLRDGFQMFDEFSQLGPANAICTVYHKASRKLFMTHRIAERLR